MAALIVVLSVMNGFQKEVTDRMLSVLAHVEVFDNSGSMPDWRAEAAQAFKNPAVKGAAPFVETQGMLLRDDALRPAIVRGVLPEESRTSPDGRPDAYWVACQRCSRAPSISCWASNWRAPCASIWAKKSP